MQVNRAQADDTNKAFGCTGHLLKNQRNHVLSWYGAVQSKSVIILSVCLYSLEYSDRINSILKNTRAAAGKGPSGRRRERSVPVMSTMKICCPGSLARS